MCPRGHLASDLLPTIGRASFIDGLQLNAYVERFNRTVRYEWLSQYHWEDLDHVQRFATDWMWTYSHDRPSIALGGFTPKQRLPMAA
ncbi:transposase [Burkholderia pseudomallei]|nr:transposase [Burkholderia pseudomallei]